MAVALTPGRIGALEGGAHVSTEARVLPRHHARGAFDAHEGCAKASKHCNCDNRTSDFPKDDAGSVLRPIRDSGTAKKLGQVGCLASLPPPAIGEMQPSSGLPPPMGSFPEKASFYGRVS